MTNTTEPDDGVEANRLSMSRRATLRALGGATLGGAAIASTSTTASAQETETPTPTPSDEEEEEGAAEKAAEAAEEATEPTYLAQLSPTARVLDYRIREVDSETARIAVDVETDVPTLFVLSDVLGGLSSEGVSMVQQERTTLPSGKGTLSMDVGLFDDELAGLGVATSGGAVTISTGLPGKGNPTVSLPQGLAIGGGTMIAGTLAAAWQKVNDASDTPENAFEKDGGFL
jgi:hypothetical protein